MCQSFFFNKVAGLRHKCFHVNFAEFLRTAFLQNTPVAASLTTFLFFKNLLNYQCHVIIWQCNMKEQQQSSSWNIKILECTTEELHHIQMPLQYIQIIIHFHQQVK